ncbi:MAG: protein kinase domain-containing protein [Planctomycetota bacterium]|jgi:serine/threonine-protein kinase
MPNPDEVSFGKIAVEMKYATTSQIEEAFEIQQKMALLGVYPKSLAEILMDRGILSQFLVRTIYKEQGTREGFPEVPGYEIVSKIGHGGMGTVYRAKQVNLDRTVAIKVLDPELAKDRNFVTRFLREARSVAQLNHENIIVGIDVGKTPREHFYFVMEYVEGNTVYEILKKEHHFEEARALEITQQIARALKHAADHNLVHRDIKPDNIMITKEGVAKLCDLGLAKSTRGKLRLTQAGSTHGTPHYMSPEQARGKEDIDIRSDIYSLGATLYHMLVGEVPFDGESAAVILLKHISEDVPSPRVQRPEIDENTCHVLERMMAKRRVDRYQAPDELVEDLERILVGENPKSRRLSPGASSILRIPSDLITAPPPSETFREEATEAMARSSLVGSGYVRPVAWLAGAVFLLAVFSGVIMGFRISLEERKATRGSEAGTANPQKTKGDQNGSFRTTIKEENWAKSHFHFAVDYEVTHPNDDEGILSRFLAIIQTYPWTQYAFEADRKIRDYLKENEKKVNQAFENIRQSVRSHLEGGRYSMAQEILNAELKRFQYLVKLKLGDRVPSLEKMRDLARDVVKQARMTCEQKFRDAERLEKGGAIPKAIQLMEAVKGAGLPDLAEKARTRIALLEDLLNKEEEKLRREEEKKALQRYFNFLARVGKELKERNHAEALKQCDEAMASEGLKRYRDRCAVMKSITVEAADIWKKAMSQLAKLAEAESKVVLDTRSGTVVEGWVGPVRKDGKIPVYHDPPRKVEKTTVNLMDLSCKEVLDQAGFAYKGRPLSPGDHRLRGVLFLAEGHLEDAAEALNKAVAGNSSVEGYWATLEDLRKARREAEADSIFTEANRARESGELKKARGGYTKLLEAFQGTHFMEQSGPEIRQFLVDVSQRLASRRNLHEILRGRIEKFKGGMTRVSYDFLGLPQMEDWEFTGDRDPDKMWEKLSLSGGGIRGAGNEGLRWKGRFSGQVEIEVRLRIDEDVRFVNFLRLEYPTRNFVFRLGLKGGYHQILFEPRGAGERKSVPLGNMTKSNLKPGESVKVKIAAGEWGILFIVGETQGPADIKLSDPVKGGGRFSLWADPVEVSYLIVQVDCHLDSAWVLGDNR